MNLTEFPLKGLTKPSQLYRLVVGEVIPRSGETLLAIGTAIAPEANIGSRGYLDYYTKDSEKTFVICNLGVEPPFPRLIVKAGELNREIENFVREKGLNKILIENVNTKNQWLGLGLSLCGYEATREGGAEKIL